MRFSKKPALFALISLLSLAAAAMGCASAVQGLRLTSIESHVSIIPMADAWLALSVACDVTITYVPAFFFCIFKEGMYWSGVWIWMLYIDCRCFITSTRAGLGLNVSSLLYILFSVIERLMMDYVFGFPYSQLGTDSIISQICRTTVEAAVPVTLLCVRSHYLEMAIPDTIY